MRPSIEKLSCITDLPARLRLVADRIEEGTYNPQDVMVVFNVDDGLELLTPNPYPWLARFHLVLMDLAKEAQEKAEADERADGLEN